MTHSLGISKPKFVFVSSLSRHVISALEKLSFVKQIILFDDETLTKSPNVISLKNFIKKHEKGNFDVENFLKKSIDVNNQTGLIFMSSGTTGG